MSEVWALTRARTRQRRPLSPDGWVYLLFAVAYALLAGLHGGELLAGKGDWWDVVLGVVESAVSACGWVMFRREWERR